MKRIFERNDFVFFGIDIVSVGLHHLHCAFGRFGPAVGEEGAFEAADFGDTPGERPLELVVKQVGSVDQPRGLILYRFHDPRMVLPQRIHSNARDEIEIAFAGRIPHVRPVAALQHQRVPGVVLKEIPLLQFDGIIHLGGC